ncbi:MAG TPA: PAS domain-containing protein [Candidatus Ozemobacteraceae bacterium]|nr:PAS domain-containing protein [Candidatus Ozemobacteraceae bacterium]
MPATVKSARKRVLPAPDSQDALRALQSEFTRLLIQSKASDKRLQELETILDLLPILITFVSPTLRFIWVNKAYADWYCLPRQNIIGKSVRDVIDQASFRGARKHMLATLSGKSVVFENIAFGADKKMKAVRASYIPARAANGKVIGFIATVEDITAQKLAERQRDQGLEVLTQAQAEIKALRGIIPICCNCKKIRNDKGYWQLLESYIQEHSEADFTHGICPDCAEQLYPTLKCAVRRGT